MRLLVLGTGVSGRAAARLAVRHGHAVTLFDEHHPDPAGLLGLGVGLVSGAWDSSLLEGVDVVVASPGFSERSLPVVETLEYGVPIWSEIEYAWRFLEDSVLIAITGTNGKTTVTELTTCMLSTSGVSAVSAGNIGTALSDVVDDPPQVVVVEVSSFQLRFIDRFHAPAAALLNIAPDHLDWHGSFESYAAAKARIFENQVADDLLVFDSDDPGASRAVMSAPSTLHPVSALTRPPGGSGRAGDRLEVGPIQLEIDELGSADPAHLVDMAAAGVLALHNGADPAAVARVMRQFAPGAHRRQVVGAVDGVVYVDDSKATNPHAALAAIAAYPSVVLIAGGLAKNLDLRPLAEAPNVRAVLAIGAAAPDLLEAAGARGEPAESMEAAVRRAARLARPGDTVLLAPGAASFDQFESYGQRGEVFAAAVDRLREEDR
jgi:UDP-N-acetylmuramoylalanine--D-glutamate ligase